MNLESFWIMMSEPDSSAAIGIMAVVLIATAAVLYYSRRSAPMSLEHEKQIWQSDMVNLFLTAANQVMHHGEFAVRHRDHPQGLMEYVDVQRFVTGSHQPIQMISVEVSRYRGDDKAILIKHPGIEQYFRSADLSEALEYFQRVFTEMASR